MFYEDEKLREMARSILPSTSREWARWAKKKTKRRSRRRIRQLCRQATRDWEDLEEYDLQAYPNKKLNRIRRYRQGADKLNHFERWALKRTDHLGDDAAGRLAYIRGLLPGGLIGWHAVQHLEAYPEFQTNRWSWRWGLRRRGEARRTHPRSRYELLEFLRVVTSDPDALALFNAPRTTRLGAWGPVIGYRQEPEGLVPIRLNEVTEHRPQLALGDEAAWLDRAFSASRNRRTIAVPPVDLVGLKFVTARVANPAWRPEWLQHARDFGRSWTWWGGDLDKMRARFSA